MQILMDRGLTEAEAKAALGTEAHSATNVTATTTTDALTVSTGALKASLKGLWATIKAHPIIAILAGIAITAKIVSETLSFEAKMDKLKESAEELADVKSEIDSLNSELSTTVEKIDELESKDSLSFVEKEELARLKQTNAELETQIALQNAIKASNEKSIRGF